MMLTGYITLFFMFLGATALFYLPVLFMLRKRGLSLLRQFSFLLCFWSFFFIVFMTVILFNLPFHFTPADSVVNFTPLRWLQEGNIKRRVSLEIVPNILLFVPFGFFLPIAMQAMRKLYKTALLALLVTLGVEFFQFFIGRSSDIDDIMANLLGGISGYILFKIVHMGCKNKTWWRRLLNTSI